MARGRHNPQFSLGSVPMAVERRTLRDGDAGIADTVQWMSDLVNGPEGAQNPYVRKWALEATRGAPSHNASEQIRRLMRKARRELEFRGEKDETLQSPFMTLYFGAGDCDDFSTLLAAAAQSLGIPAQFITVAADPSDPSEFTHVYPEAYDERRGDWIPMDATVRGSYPGWQPLDIARKQRWARGMGRLGLSPADLQMQLLNAQIADGYIPGVDVSASDKLNFAGQLLGPIDQALAIRLAGGAGGAGPYGVVSTGIPGWAWALGAVGIVFFAMRR